MEYLLLAIFKKKDRVCDTAVWIFMYEDMNIHFALDVFSHKTDIGDYC